MVRTPPDRKVVGAGPVGSGHGSYQLVSWWGGRCWCPPMAHAQWWQRRRGVAAWRGARNRTADVRGKTDVRTAMCSSSRRRGSRSLTATTEHGPWGGTNTGHPTMILTGMTCPLPTGPAPTTFRSGGVLTTCAHFSPTTTTPLVWPRPPTERALYEEAAHVTKRIRVLHPKTSPAGYCAPLGASIQLVCKFSPEGTKGQRRIPTKPQANQKDTNLRTTLGSLGATGSRAVIWVLGTKIQKRTVSRPPEAHSGPSERF